MASAITDVLAARFHGVLSSVKIAGAVTFTTNESRRGA